MKKILVANPGSTSTKYKLFDLDGVILSEKNFLISENKEERSFLKSLVGVEKIGIRVVHGGDISETSEITEFLKNKINDFIDFAPIHNVRALVVIKSLENIFLNIPQYATFDTAFHTSIPDYLSTYALPEKLAEKYNLKKYGFHGIAIQSALNKLETKKSLEANVVPRNIVFAHLGGGCSVTAVKDGKSLCTSMGLTPLSGIMMTTRVGEIDSDIYKILSKRSDMDVEEISDLLSHDSGFKGLTGSTNTLEIFDAAREGSKKEKLAYDIFVAEIVEKIWGYAGLMQGIDTLVFSGGIGFGNKQLRNDITKKVLNLGITESDIYAISIDEELVIFNEIRNK